MSLFIGLRYQILSLSDKEDRIAAKVFLANKQLSLLYILYLKAIDSPFHILFTKLFEVFRAFESGSGLVSEDNKRQASAEGDLNVLNTQSHYLSLFNNPNGFSSKASFGETGVFLKGISL